MNLNELKSYKGCNPKPKDFDAYWDKAISEINDIDPKVELIPAKFKCSFADCFDLFFTGAGGARVHANFIRPKKIKNNSPAVVRFHGYMGDSGDWFDKLGFPAEGFVFAALNCRGQGGKSEDVGGVKGTTLNGHIIRGLDDDNPENLLFRQIFLDAALLTKIIMNMPEVDSNRVGVLGGSQGGALTLAAAALVPEIKLAAPTHPFLCDYKRVWELNLFENCYKEIQTFFRQFDPEHERENEIFTKLGYIDIQFLMPRVKAKVLMGTGLLDTMCPLETQFAAYNKITSEKKLKIYPDYGHEPLPGYSDAVFEFMRQL